MKLHLILNHPYFYPLLIGIAGGAIAGYFYWESSVADIERDRFSFFCRPG